MSDTGLRAPQTGFSILPVAFCAQHSLGLCGPEKASDLLRICTSEWRSQDSNPDLSDSKVCLPPPNPPQRWQNLGQVPLGMWEKEVPGPGRWEECCLLTEAPLPEMGLHSRVRGLSFPPFTLSEAGPSAEGVAIIRHCQEPPACLWVRPNSLGRGLPPGAGMGVERVSRDKEALSPFLTEPVCSWTPLGSCASGWWAPCPPCFPPHPLRLSSE